VSFVCHFFVIFLPFCCHFGVICLSFSCRFLIQRGWLDPEPSWKVQKRDMFLSFSHPDPASGEGGKPGLGNAKKNAKK